MLPVREQISFLVHLPKINQNLAPTELDVIFEAGKSLGLSQGEVQNLIERPDKVINLKNLPSEERFECSYMNIQLMKAYEKVFQSENQCCEKVTIALGYQSGVVGDLSAYIYSDNTLTTNVEHLCSIADQQLL